MIFGILLAVIIIALGLNFYRLVKRANIRSTTIEQTFIKEIVEGLGVFKKTNQGKQNLFSRIRQFLYSLSIVLFGIMAISGLFLPLFWQPTTGFLLFVHLFIAPFFALSITVSIALYAHKLQFNSADYQILTKKVKTAKQKMAFWKKIHFWLFVAAVILNIGSIVCAMYTLFGTSGQYWLLNMHRFSALVLLVLTVNYLTLRYVYKKNI
jgi:hypothetical protein